MADIFISYAREDVGVAERLAAALEAYGWSVFWDRHTPAGRRFDEFIAEQLGLARCVIVLWSAAAIQSEWVVEEAAEGKDRNVLAPALIDAVRPPFGFRHRQCADLIGWDQDISHPGFERLVADIVRLCGLPQKSPREEGQAHEERQSAQVVAKLEPPEEQRQSAEAEAKREPPEEQRQSAEESAGGVARHGPDRLQGQVHAGAIRPTPQKMALGGLVIVVLVGFGAFFLWPAGQQTPDPIPIKDSTPSEFAKPLLEATVQPAAPAPAAKPAVEPRTTSGQQPQAARARMPSSQQTQALLTGATAAVPDIAARSRDPGWRAAAPPAIRARLDRIEQNLAESFASLDSADGDAIAPADLQQLRQVLDPPSVVIDAGKLLGPWRCRKLLVARLGLFVYPYFDCAIEQQGQCLRLAKSKGLQRFSGCLSKVDDRYLAFIGQWQTDYETGDEGGFLSQTAADRLRLILPGGGGGTGFEFIDLQRR